MNRPATKRRQKRIKPGVLAVYYAKLRHSSADIVIHNEAPAARPDAHYMHGVFSCSTYDIFGKEQPSVVDELQTRGYDITTLSFSISKLKDASK